LVVVLTHLPALAKPLGGLIEIVVVGDVDIVLKQHTEGKQAGRQAGRQGKDETDDEEEERKGSGRGAGATERDGRRENPGDAADQTQASAYVNSVRGHNTTVGGTYAVLPDALEVQLVGLLPPQSAKQRAVSQRRVPRWKEKAARTVWSCWWW
jgi:hypothetical protein